MGSRYEFYKNCPNCGATIECYYAPTCGFEIVQCRICKKNGK